ncbi:MAG: ATP-dependent DNA helicase, partial [Candidatus Thermoplasmatota archaeon]
MDFFPYTPRKNQVAIIETIRKTLRNKGNLVFESGTGSGKTVCTLSSALEYALENDKKIVYTTRTNAQQRQVMVELREIRDKNPNVRDEIFGVGMQGRGNMCILAGDDPDFSGGTAEELSKLCSNEKKKARSNGEKNKGCVYYRTFLNNKEKVNDAVEWFKEKLPTAEEFIDFCREKQLCPYELNKLLLKDSKVVVVPYIYVFDVNIRNMLFDWLGVSEYDLILVVDEAHNLPDYIRDLFSAELSFWMLKNCVNEADKYGDPAMLDGKYSLSEFCKLLEDILIDLRDTYVYNIKENELRQRDFKKNDAFIPSHEFDTEILSRLKITSKHLHDIIGDLIAYGEKIQEYREKEGKLPRSYLHKLGLFLEFWVTLEMDQYAKLVVDSREGKNPRIEAYCLDPSVGAEVLKKFHSTIHMSGTLEPLEEYRDSMGLGEKTELIAYPSPFPKSNRRVLFVRDVTTKYSEIMKNKDIVSRMNDYISDVCNSFPRNTMVFFPSFNTMSTFMRNGLRGDIDRCLFIEKQGMSQAALMDVVSDFKESSGDENCAAMFS